MSAIKQKSSKKGVAAVHLINAWKLIGYYRGVFFYFDLFEQRRMKRSYIRIVIVGDVEKF